MARKKRKYHRHLRHRRQTVGIKLKKQTVYTVGAIWLWIFAIILTFSFFADGYVMELIRKWMSDRFGWSYFFLPPILVSLSFLFFKTKSLLGKPNVPIGLIIIAFAFMTLTQAGYYGEKFWIFFVSAFSREATVILLVVFLSVGIIIMANASLEGLINAVFARLPKFLSVEDKAESEKGKTKKPEKPLLSLPFLAKTPLKIKGGEEEKPFSAKAAVTAVPAAGRETKAPPLKSYDPLKSELKISGGSVKPLTSSESFFWEYPQLSLLSDGPGQKADRGDVRENAGVIEETLRNFGITAKVTEVNRGPAVTQYALKLSMGTKVSKITSLASDLALSLAAPTGTVRIEAPIPGRDLVGVEVPNRGLEFVTLKRMLQSDAMRKSKSKLAVTLGLDVSGAPVVADIGKMPHVLVAGTTGSGKSVLINSWISSLLFRTTPREVKLILVDPKRVELIGYNGVPHLLTPVIVEPDKILSALRWAMGEMDQRYKQFAAVNVRNIDGFNELSGFQAMPYIVIFIDELADLMAYAPAEVEDAICRIAQMARATGIHLVLATQRPSVDVITGLIKANVPSRVAFNVSSMIDSRVIIDMPGAEKLLGRGDMLFIPPDQSKPSRIQGTYVSEREVQKVVDFLKEKNQPVEYTDEVISQSVTVGGKRGSLAGMMGTAGDGKDPLFADAIRLICQHDKASASLLQRRLSVGYARAARILDQLEEAGVIGPGEGSKPRDVLVKSPEEYYARENAGSASGE
jgi:S-DNA-T family DNA segregation ATPase FtsK/SpoIIIE